MALTQIKTDAISDDAVTLAKQAAGTDGQIITYDASGNPTAVGPGTDGQVLTSTGAGSPPAFESPAAGVGGATGVDFNDDVKARFGTGNDLNIYHDGANSYIDNVTGAVYIRCNNTETSGKFFANSQVELYYDNVKKFETVTGGATITGTCTATAFAGDGSALTGVSSSSANGCIWKNTLTISDAHTIAATEGAHSVGPITLSNTVTVNGRWVIS